MRALSNVASSLSSMILRPAFATRPSTFASIRTGRAVRVMGLQTAAAASAGAGSSAAHRQVRVAHILVDSAEAVQDVSAQLKGGADFAALAKERSTCTATARRGGVLGWLAPGSFLPEFESAAFATAVGAVTTAHTERGHHAILVLDEKVEAPVQQMTVEELAQLMGDVGLSEDVQFVDVREGWEFDTARLPRFQLLPLSTFQEWSPKLGTELLERDKETVVLCHHGVRSMQLARHLVASGFTDVKNVVGGIDAFSHMDSRVPMY